MEMCPYLRIQSDFNFVTGDNHGKAEIMQQETHVRRKNNKQNF